MGRYEAVGFDLLTALLDSWSLWARVAGDRALATRWHATAQGLLRGRPYRPYEGVVREAALAVGLGSEHAEELLRRWGELEPWPDVANTLRRLGDRRSFIVTNCSEALGAIAAARAGSFDLVMTAEHAGAYKPDPRPYRAALNPLGLDPAAVLFVAGSAHDIVGATRVGMDVYWANRLGAPPPADGKALREAPDLRGLLAVLG